MTDNETNIDESAGSRKEAEPIRLQKILAKSGFGSRRACEILIDAGRVEVDGVRVTTQGMRVDPRRQVIKVDGSRVVTDERLVYLALNKPRGLLATMSDDRGRPCVGDLVAGRAERLFHVGRLDADSEGLLLLTNDGELANLLMHPSHGVQKTYLAEIKAPVARELGRTLRAGVELDDGPAKVDSFRLIASTPATAMVEIIIHEGRKHIVRRMLEHAGYPVLRLIRTAVGPVQLAEMRPGVLRKLGSDEVGRLYDAADTEKT